MQRTEENLKPPQWGTSRMGEELPSRKQNILFGKGTLRVRKGSCRSKGIRANHQDLIR